PAARELPTGLEGLLIPAVPVAALWTLAERRPDIRAAEERLIAANADIGAARAAFYPVFNLGADATAAFSPISDPAATVLALAASAAAPIFKRGQLQGGLAR